MGAVVVGFDRHINYFKIQTAQLCISENPGCLFIATNLDAKTHLTDAQEWAGNGAMVGAIKGAPCPGCAPDNWLTCYLSLLLWADLICYRCQVMVCQAQAPLHWAGQQAQSKP